MSAFSSDGVICPSCKSSLPWFGLCRGPGTNYKIIPYCPICSFRISPGIDPLLFTSSKSKMLDRRKPVQLLLFGDALLKPPTVLLMGIGSAVCHE